MKVNNLRTLVNLFLVLLPLGYLHSQSVTNYNFTAVAGTYTPITGTLATLSGGTNDEGWVNNIPIGFNFCYLGQTYSVIHASTNGFAALGSPLTGAVLTNNLATGTPANRPILAPLWDDMEINASGSIRYVTTGTSGNQVFTLQWSNMEWNYNAAGPVISFQLKLYEATGEIEFIYNQEPTAVNSGSASIGITSAGTGSGNFLSLSDASGSPTVSSTVETTTINAKPATGQVYRFSPQYFTTPATPLAQPFTSVTATTMTVYWEDNSTNETYFVVLRSTDNITYTPVATVTSASIATTGTIYNFVATGLSANTLYYWRIEARNDGCSPSAPLQMSQSTTPGVLCGTYSVGPTGAYTSLTAAFADLAINSLSCPCNFELQAAYNSSVETFPLNVPNFGGSAANTVTVRPETGATALSITSADLTATLIMNGTSWITFDGRPGGIGTNLELEISNTNTLGSAILYQNNTQNTGMTYLNIRGVTTPTTNGVVNFSNALTSGGGNSNNSITYCDLFAGATNPTNMIYSNNTTAGTFNQNNIISNNTIRDFFNATQATSGIAILAGNNAWTISDNSFYQTAPRTYIQANTHSIIAINNTGGNYTITNNFLGGSAPNCGGTPYAMGGTIATRLVGINFAAIGATPSNINNNTIQNFTLNTSSGATTANGIWCGINVTGTGTTCNVLNNTIGNTTTTGNITTTTSTSGGLTVGIHCSGTGVININNNSIGSISTLGSSGTISTSVTAINISTSTGTGLRTISGNTIGSLFILNSITTAASTGATAGNLIGIGVLIGGNYTISNNIISRVTNQYSGTSTSSITRGIHVTNGVANISGNTITSIGTLSPSTGTGTNSSLAGIQMSSTVVGNQIISGNVIGVLLNANNITTNATQTIGIIHSGATTSITTISKNAIGFIGSNANSVSAANIGILLAAGRSRTFNNFINLGLNPDATPRTGAQIYEGIRLANIDNNSILFNTVGIQGTGVASGVANTSAFNRTSSGTADSLINNIFVNNRSNATTGGTHYAIQLNNGTGLTINNNDYYGNGTDYVLGRFNLVNQPTLAAWQGATGQDALSISSDPNFISSLDLHIYTTPPNSALESTAMPIAGINDDIDSEIRPGPTNFYGGGFFPDMGADEFDGTPIPNGNNDLAIIRLVDPNSNTCYSTNTQIKVRIRSFAITPIDFSVDNATINMNVTGPNPQVYSITLNSGIINPGDSLDVLITSTYDMSAVGNYTFSGNVSIANDLNAGNNTLTSSMFGLGETTVSTTPVSPICNGASVALNATENAAWKQQTFTNNTVINIPDNDLTGITSIITLPGSFSSINASDIMSVTVDITHTFNADLDIYLKAPNGSQIELSTDNGGAGDGYINVTFTPNAAQNITAAPTSPNISGSWQPEQPFSSLTGTANGNWSLIVADDASGDVGTLNSWSITLYGPAQTVTYSWSPATGLSSTTIPNPVASPTTTTVYTVQVTDERGCTATDNVTVTVNPLPGITKVTTDPTCSPGNDGVIDITVSGNSPFSFNWSTVDTSEDLTGLTFGTYTVTVTDANGCTATDATTFAVPGFNVSGVVTDVSCNSGNDGAIDVTVTGGTSPYSYNWSSGQTTEDITGITANTYTITVTDNNGCIAGNTFVVTEPTPIVITLNSLTHVDCNGNSTGAIDISVSGGTPGYSFNWISLPSTPIATTEDVSSLPAGTYEITVTDGNTCTATDTYTINEPAILTVSAVATDVTCNGLNNGQIDITVTGGTTNYSYAWSNGATTEDISSLAPDTYTVTVTDFNGCQTTTQATITEPAVLSSTINATDALCYGSTDGTVSVTPSGGTTPYAYNWSNGGSGSFITVGAGTYTVTITDNNGCTTTNSATVNQPLLLTATITSFSNVTCHNANNGSATVVAGFGTPGYTYAWSNGSTSTTASGLDGGTYTVTVTDNNGCTATATVTIIEPSQITATSTNTDEVWGNDGAIDITPAGGTPPYTFSWSNGATTEDNLNITGGTYTVTITDNNGCTQSFTYTIVSYVGIFNETNTLGINFYPNPSNGQLNMSVAGFKGGTLQLDVLDINGKVVHSSQIQNAPESFIQEMDLRSLTMGTYFIRVTSENGVHTSRIIIARD